jgi:AbrB family looped-hinge helix DNA binding protein
MLGSRVIGADLVLHFRKCKESPVQSAVTAKGQITVPKPIRDHLGVKPGDRIKFFVHPDGTVVLFPTRPITDLRGMLKSSRQARTIEEMDEAIASGVTERYLRSGEQ